jgi:hypothetical protein
LALGFNGRFVNRPYGDNNVPVNKLLAKIHIAKKDLGISDDDYRFTLSKLFQVESSRDLTDEKALKLIRHFKDMGWMPKVKEKKYDNLGARDAYAANPAQLRLIEVLWHQVSYSADELVGLRKFLYKTVGVSDVRFLTKKKAYDAIEAIKAIKSRKAFGERRSASEGKVI